MSIGSNLRKAEKVINNFDKKTFHDDINYILELYNIRLLFKIDIKLNDWSNEYYEEMKKIVKKFESIIGRFFSILDYDKLKSIYSDISIDYQDTFWETFVRYKTYKKLSFIEFSELLRQNNVPLDYILSKKEIVKCFDVAVSNYMQQIGTTAEILIRHHLVRKESNEKQYYIPNSLDANKQMEMIAEYVDSDNVNPNYLKLLYKSRSTSEFPISDILRLKSKKRYEEFLDKVSVPEFGLTFGATVAFDDIEESFMFLNKDPLNPEIIYSRHWLKENLDNPTLMNNFIHLFGYTDSRFRSTFPSKKTEMSVLERLINVKGNKHYETGLFFSLKDIISNIQIGGYYYELLKLDKRLEDIFKWFFEVYLSEEFNIDGFIFSSPSFEATYLEKIRTLCSELDSVLRQFDNYVKYGEINRELLELSRTTPLIENVPSFFQMKYGYIVDTELKNISYQLFSDQSSIKYIEGKEKYSSFEKLVINEKVKIDDFFEFQRPSLEWLIEKKIIYKSTSGYIQLNKHIVNILKDYYLNEVICLKYYKNDEVLNNLITANKIKCESTLFSMPEQKYLNFMLNDREFDNGPTIRNKYAHGNNPQNVDDHETDYFRLLKIMALVIIKINEEFCLKD